MLPRSILPMVVMGFLFAWVSCMEASGSDIQQIPLFQAHSMDFWQVNGDNAASQAGELAFLWINWNTYQDYDYITIYNTLVNTSYTPYLSCYEDTTCSQESLPNRKHAGAVEMGYVAICSSSSSSSSPPITMEKESVSYYDVAWYSFPKDGACQSEESMGLNGCGFYVQCAIKSVSRSCLESKQGWTEALEANDYYALWPIFALAFQEESFLNGGCPDETAKNFTVCSNAAELLKKKETYGGTVQQSASIIPKDFSSISTSPSSTPLIGVDVASNSVCQIFDGECKSLLEFDPPLSSFLTSNILSASSNGVVYFYLEPSNKSLGTSSSTSVIMGYEFGSNIWVVNFNIDVRLQWFAIDENDNCLVGVVSDDPSNLQFNLVKIDLTNHQSQNITSYPIYNTTNLSLRKTIAYDPLSNTIYFPGLSPYSQWPTFNSYSLNSSLAMVFPIVTFNQSLLTLTWGVFSDASSSSSGLFGINGNGWLGQLNPATGNYFPNFVSKSSPRFYFGPQGSSLTFDSKAMALTFCDHSSGYSLVTFDFASQTLTSLVYPCQKYPFQYISA